MRAILALLLAVGLASAETYYLDGNDGDNGNDGLTVGNAWLTFAYAQSQVSAGDTVLISPGDYGSVTFADTCFGSEGSVILFQADPATCTARPSNWYESVGDVSENDDGVVPRPDEVGDDEKYPIFDGITFLPHTTTPTPRYVELDGLWVLDGIIGFNGNLSGEKIVEEITVRNCNVFGNGQTHLYIQGQTQYAFHTHDGGHYRNLLIEDNYVEFTIKFAHVWGKRGPNIVFRGNHAYHMSSSIMGLHGGGYENDTIADVTLIDGNHFEHQFPKPESSGNPALSHGSLFAVSGSHYDFRNNVCHGGGGSRGVLHYFGGVGDGDGAPGGRGYLNCTFHNNLLYDVTNNAVAEMGEVSGAMTITQNTFISKIDSTGGRPVTSDFYLETCFRTSLRAGSGYAGADYVFDNNICAGAYSVTTNFGDSNDNYVHVDYHDTLDAGQGNTEVNTGGLDVSDTFTDVGGLFVGESGWVWEFNGSHGNDYTELFQLTTPDPNLGVQYDELSDNWSFNSASDNSATVTGTLTITGQ